MPAIQVVAGFIINDDQKILIAKRKLNEKHGADLWEFPGGKIEAGENYQQALTREISEEFLTKIEAGKHAFSNRHQYKDELVELHFVFAKWLGQKLTCQVHSEFKWVTIEELKQFEFAAADTPAIDYLMSLPRSFGNSRKFSI